MAKVFAPWIPEQVQSLNEYQRCDYVHPFTGDEGETLLATEQGWRLTAEGPVVQDWAHDFMANQGWRQLADSIERLVDGISKP